MEDLIGIVVLILYFVAAGAAGKKKKKKKAKQRASRSREAQFEQAFERLSSAHKRMVGKSIDGAASRDPRQISLKLPGEGDDPCHEPMLTQQRETMRVQSVSQAQMHQAGEGEDPCHLGAAEDIFAPLEDSPVYRSPIFNTEDKDAFAQDVLRGVVMSEVLARPVSRRTGRDMKRGA